MKKLLRILFVMSAIAFVTTVTACADDKKDATTKTPSIFEFKAEAKGVAIDTSKEVVKITIRPSLLTYASPAAANVGAGITALNYAKLFTVTFKDEDLQGFIIPTTAASADKLATTHSDTLVAAAALDIAPGVANAAGLIPGAANDVTRSFLADAAPGFSATELHAAWSTIAPRAAGLGNVNAFNGLAAGILTDTKVRVKCETKITGITALSFAAAPPADPATDDKAIAKGTNTVCSFSLVGDEAAADDEVKLKAAYALWETAAVALKDKNVQKMGFVGIVTGTAKASEISKVAGTVIGVAGIKATASALLVKEYKTSLQKVEIVIAENK